MKDKKLARVLDQVTLSREREEAILADLLREEKEERKVNKSKKPVVALAVAAAMLLATGALAAAGIPGIGMLTNWLNQKWETQTDTPMAENQTELLNRLTMPVGVSDTVDGVTITVDSVTVGDNTLWALLVVDGLEGPLPESGVGWDHTYHMGLGLNWWVTPLDNFDRGPVGAGIDSSEVTDDGRLCLITYFTTQMAGESSYLNGCHAEYMLEEICYGDQTLAKGPWILAFDTEPIAEIECLTLDTAQFPAWKDGQGVLVDVENVRVSTSGISYMRKDNSKNPSSYIIKPIVLIFQDGAEVGPAPSMTGYRKSGNPDAGINDYWIESLEWPAPIDLTQVEAIRVGDIVFPLQ